MQQSFWLERWQHNQIGFHDNDINSHLKQNWSSLALPKNSQVFVPFCGKTNDLLWLREQGHQIMAVELSLIAVESFLSENQLLFKRDQVGEFELFETEGIQIYCGDFFKLSPDMFSDVVAVYDRASLIALPFDMREYYAAKMHDLLPFHTVILLVALYYPQHEMQGPPFCVGLTEVNNLFANWCGVEHLYIEDITDKEPHFKAKGLSQILEEVYRITIKNRG